MEFGDFKATEAFNPTYRRIKELALEPHIAISIHTVLRSFLLKKSHHSIFSNESAKPFYESQRREPVLNLPSTRTAVPEITKGNLRPTDSFCFTTF